MIEYLVQNFWLMWTVVGIVCLILEITSGDFFLTCIAVGAFVAGVSSVLALPFWAQVVVFAAMSVVSIYFIRPHLTALLHKGGNTRLSNADAIIGRIGVVSETVKGSGFGRVKIDGDDWKAQTSETDDIEVGMKVRVVGRESVIIDVESVD